MSSRLNGAGLFTQLISGINNSYASALQNADSNSNGVSLNNILSSLSGNTNATSLLSGTNSTFASYLSSNFTGLDSDGDGVISNNEISTFTNQLYQQGLTQEQLALLCSYGNASNTLQTVLDNFDKIDANNDGKVTQKEISAYGIDEEVSEKKEQYKAIDPKRMSLFYSASSDNSSNN